MKNALVKIFARPFAARTLAAAALPLCLGALLPGFARAVPANPAPVELTQPDGTKITVSLKGDEFYHWNEDGKGYTIFKDTATGNWVYGEKDAGGALKAGKLKAGIDDPAKSGFQKHLLDAVKVGRAKARRAQRNSSSSLFAVSGHRTVTGDQAPAKTPILAGPMKNLVILAEFSDLARTRTQAEFTSLFNTIGYNFDGAVGSVKDFYNEISYNKLTVESTVSQWVTLPNGYAFYGANVGGDDKDPQQMVEDALTILNNASFDFASLDQNGDGWVDGLTIIHSGQGEESGAGANYIWSHQWSLASVFTTHDGKKLQMYHTEPELRDATKITRIGVICHETGHFLGLPDLYDYGGDSQGAGDFCLMAGGSWNGVDGKSPAHMSAWCRKTLGWATATQLSTYGVNTLPRIQDNDTALVSMRNANFGANEYFLLENRQGYGFDSGLPGTSRGILIWHVDENVADNDNQAHYKVDLEEASGTQHLANNTSSGDDFDYYRAGNNTTFTDSTVPDSRSYLGYNLGLPIQDISASGNSMTFVLPDSTNPTDIATVNDGTTPGFDISKTGSNNQLSANWTTSTDPETGIKAYWYAIGTAPGNANITAWKDNGLQTSTTAAGLSLSNGTTYYFGVKAENNLNMFSNMTWSNGQWVDISMPLNVPYVYDGLGGDITYTRSQASLSANWGASPSGGVTKYWYAIGTTPGGTEKLPWTDNYLSQSVTRTGLSPLTEGVTYYFSVKVQNGFGFYSGVTASDGQRVDVTSPTARVLITSSIGAVKTGLMTLKLITTEANGLTGTPTLSFTPAGGSARSIPLTYLVSSTWTGSAYIESFYSSGTASFSFSASDPAGNAGAQITVGPAFAGPTFVIDTSVSGTAGGTVVNSDTTTVIIPAGGYPGNLVIAISTVASSRTAAADAATHDSYPVYSSNLTREFSARDAATGVSVSNFASTVTIKMYYPDADGDGYIDGNYILEDLTRFYLLNETLGAWIPVTDAAQNPAGNFFTVQVPHFSVYTIRIIDVSRLGMSAIKAYPNPCYFDKPPFELRIEGLPLDAADPKIYIYNTAGEHVRTLTLNDGINPITRKGAWTGKLKGGGKAASGLYLYVLKTNNYGKTSGKFYIFQ